MRVYLADIEMLNVLEMNKQNCLYQSNIYLYLYIYPYIYIYLYIYMLAVWTIPFSIKLY